MTRHPSTGGRSVFCCLQQGSATSTLEISSLLPFTAVWEKEHRHGTDWKEKLQGQRKDKNQLLSQLTSKAGSQHFFFFFWVFWKGTRLPYWLNLKFPLWICIAKPPNQMAHRDEVRKSTETICKTTQKKSVQTLQLHWLTVFTRRSGRRKWKLTSALHCLYFEIIAYVMVKYRKFSIFIKNLFRGCLKSRAIRPWNRRTERVLQKYSISASDCPEKNKERKKAI